MLTGISKEIFNWVFWFIRFNGLRFCFMCPTVSSMSLLLQSRGQVFKGQERNNKHAHVQA